MCGGGGGAPEAITPEPAATPTLAVNPELTGLVGGREVGIYGEGQDTPGITELAYGLMAEGVDVPLQQLADFTPAQQAAFAAAEGGVGAYLPYLTQAGELTDQASGILSGAQGKTQQIAGQIPGAIAPGQRSVSGAQKDIRKAVEGAAGSTDFGISSLRKGISGLEGTGGEFTADRISPFMSQYEDAAVQQALQDIARQGQLQEQELKGQAVQAGAFGGSRQAVAEQELARNVLGEQGRTAAQMRAAGFENAAARAQSAFEDARARQQAAATATGQMGVSAGNLGLQAGQLGLSGAQAAGNLGLQSGQLGLVGINAGLGAQQQAAGIGQGIASIGQQALGMGQAGQQMSAADVNMLSRIGGQQQAQAQGQLDVDYANQYAQTMQPYQQLAYASDIIQGSPSGQMSSMTQPGPSIGSQLAGGALALYGMSQ